MGVQIYLLDRRKVILQVGDQGVEIGTLRRSWKVTEIDSGRAAEIDAARAELQGKAAPVAAMVADVSKFTTPHHQLAAHLVLGWDADRSSVTDLGWDFLPILGYAVRSRISTEYVLHEEREGVLAPVTKARALELGIFDQIGRFRRKGQPTIIECRSVRPYISSYVQADCVLSDGRTAEILTSIETAEIPEIAWYHGKRPADVSYYVMGDNREKRT